MVVWAVGINISKLNMMSVVGNVRVDNMLTYNNRIYVVLILVREFFYTLFSFNTCDELIEAFNLLVSNSFGLGMQVRDVCIDLEGQQLSHVQLVRMYLPHVHKV